MSVYEQGNEQRIVKAKEKKDENQRRKKLELFHIKLGGIQCAPPIGFCVDWLWRWSRSPSRWRT